MTNSLMFSLTIHLNERIIVHSLILKVSYLFNQFSFWRSHDFFLVHQLTSYQICSWSQHSINVGCHRCINIHLQDAPIKFVISFCFSDVFASNFLLLLFTFIFSWYFLTSLVDIRSSLSIWISNYYVLPICSHDIVIISSAQANSHELH